MSFVRTQADGVWLGGGYVPSAADWQSLATKIFRAGNGTRGGAYAPSTPVVFATGGFNVTGLVRIAYGGELETDVLTLPGLTNWPRYADGHELQKRTIVQSMLTRQSTPPEHWVADSNGAVQTISIGIQPTDRSRVVTPARMRVELDVQDSSTLKTVIFTFSVPMLRGAAPFAMPKFRVVRVDPNGSAVPLASMSAGADPNGWRSPARVVSPEAWFNAGLSHTFAYECDQSNAIDIASYSYVAEVVEEGVSPTPVVPSLLDGVTMREQKFEVEQATTAPLATAPTGSIFIDGSAPAANSRVLIKNGILNDEANTKYANGIWVVNTGGAWNRSSDLKDVVDFTKGAFVYVKAGNQNKGTTWQIGSPHPTKIPYPTGSGASDPEARITIERFVATGNKYHSIAMKFEGITEMRWQ